MRKLLVVACVILFCAAQAVGQTASSAGGAPDKARDEFYAGARAYRDGKYEEAQRHFERSLEIDPTRKNTQFALARAIQQQYKPGVTTPENVAKGEEAVAAYEKVLAAEPLHEDAYRAVVQLYGQLKNEEMVVEVLKRRAYDSSAPAEKRAEALIALASRQWKCSYDITERHENKEAVTQDGKTSIKYRKPADASDYMKAQQCAAEGGSLAEQAIQLDANNRNAWSYRASLLRESAKLAEMEGSAEQKAEYDKQYEEAQARHADLMRGSGGAAAPPEGGGLRVPIEQEGVPPSQPRDKVVAAGVLNGKALSKPAPAYPVEAKAARAQGTVTVRILVDEEGKVERAEAVSGHPALRQAAVAAARRARFTPTLLKGQPVKVSGTVTYNFVLQQ